MLPIDKFRNIPTPFYYYDTDLLRATLDAIKCESSKYKDFIVHYAVKANTNPKLLNIINKVGLGADCVSGGEIQAVINAGFPANKIVFAGVGKSDWEINLGLEKDIFCFNVESLQELEVINEIAIEKNKTANVCFRLNPNVAAHTHSNITTGLAENKFGIAMQDIVAIIEHAKYLSNINFVGLHFHIGSQITDMNDFVSLCDRINDLQNMLESKGIIVDNINVGGGLGVDYDNPDANQIPNFKDYFATYAEHLKLREGQKVHFELGRAVVAQCGNLISKVLYVKQGANKQFAIIDAGMNDLIRPALYQAHHCIENISNNEPKDTYDVVGPICESSDVFDKSVRLGKCKRGDFIAIRSAGAYGESMACQYNSRKLVIGYIKEDI